MSYFKKFPKLSYEYKKGVFKTALDTLKRVGLTEKISTNAAYWVEHEVKDSETPESLANKIYGDSTKSWLILLTNEILNPSYEWPLPSDRLYDRIVKKYEGLWLFGVLAITPKYFDLQGHWTLGDEIWNGVSEDQKVATGIVSSYDKTYKHVVLKNTTGEWPLPAINTVPIGFKDQNKYSSYSRRILEGWHAVHHFEDSNGNHISPFTNIQEVGGVDLGKESVDNRLISLYSNSGGQQEALIEMAGYKVVSNYQYELEMNENFRKIKVLKPNVARAVEESLTKQLR